MTDLRPKGKLSEALVMTPQLQLAIKLIATPSRDLPVGQWFIDVPGLEELSAGEADPMDVEEPSNAAGREEPEWYAAIESPLPTLAEVADVWVFGNPPQARANRHAYPRLKATTKEAKWLLRSLRQRAKTYEKIVQAILDLRPQLAVCPEPPTLEAVPFKDIAEAVGMHESTIERTSHACRIQNLHGIVALEKKGKKLTFKSG